MNRLIRRFDYRCYLEIGVSRGKMFKQVPIEDKIGVDPAWKLWYLFDKTMRRQTSDEFFAGNTKRFDLVFVDGLHVAEQAYRDIVNSLAALEPNGTVIVHDCLPTSEEQQRVPRVSRVWTGDVWRAFVKISQDPELDTFLLDTDCGCGVIRRGRPAPDAPTPPADRDPLTSEITWEEFDASKTEWLRIFPESSVYEVLDGIEPAVAESWATTSARRG